MPNITNWHIPAGSLSPILIIRYESFKRYHMKILTLMLAVFLFMGFSTHTLAGKQEEMASVLLSKITGVNQLAKQVRFIRAVKTQNAMGLSLDEIKQRDQQWVVSGPDSDLKQSMSSSAIGKFLSSVIKNNADKYNEMFLTDNQGANVAAFPLTSDYWQGDEAKFINAFNNGDGKVYIGDLEFDESTKVNAIQISVPVNYGNKAIGVLVIGVKVDHIEAEKLEGLK